MGDMKNKMKEMGGSPDDMGGGRGGGRGGGKGGGMGVGRSMGDPGGMQMPEKQEVWIKTILATPNSQEQDDQS